MTVRDLLDILRAEIRRPQGNAGTHESGLEQVAAEVRESDQAAKEEWTSAKAAVELIGASPRDVQICFLEGLTANPDEAERFLEDPVSYARDSGVVLDPKLIRDIVDVVQYGDELNQKLAGRVSAGALRDIAALRQRPNAGVLTAASALVVVVASAQALEGDGPVTSHLARMKGLDGQGVRLPGGRVLKAPRDVATLVASNPTAVAVYGVTATGSLVASQSRSDPGRLNIAALRGARKVRETSKKPTKE